MGKGILVGLTGQTGSGKTTVGRLLKRLGYPVIDADLAAREVTEKGSPVLQELAEAFGEDILQEDGGLDRKLLASRAFSGKDKTELLDSITHPAIIKLMDEKAQTEFDNGEKAVVLDASQLFEAGMDDECKLVVSVVAPDSWRMKRIMERDSIDESAAKERMAAQHDRQFFIDHSDYVIHNTGTLRDLSNQAREISQYIERAIENE